MAEHYHFGKGKLGLGESEKTSLTSFLYTAAVSFDGFAQEFGSIPGPCMPEFARVKMAEQFRKQAEQARELAQRIDEAAYVELGPSCVDCEEEEA